uniref:Uncharacterized protein n=1 Tax=Tetranychus urticae TaxID=32264 RepID=T1JRQ7_TETUR
MDEQNNQIWLLKISNKSMDSFSNLAENIRNYEVTGYL